MIKTYGIALVFALLPIFCCANAVETKLDAQIIEAECVSAQWQKSTLKQLKEDKFNLAKVDDKAALLMQLLNCLASPDSELRDDIAYSAISQWLRNEAFDHDIYHSMFEQLITVLSHETVDKHGVYQPFAALALSEVVRVDRQTPYLSASQRQTAVEVITHYFIELDDYRGFDQQLGWRHGVAHSADVMLQLALNQAINKAQLTQLLSALKQQIVADKNHFYIYGEPKRIAMPVIYILLRNEHSLDQWQQWLDEVVSPAPFKNWGEIYQSQQGLAKLHNTQQFLNAMYALIKSSDNDRLQSLVPALEAAMKKVP